MKGASLPVIAGVLCAAAVGLCAAAIVPAVAGPGGEDVLPVTRRQTGVWTPAEAGFRAYYGWDDAVGTWTLEYLTTAAGDSVALHRFIPRDPVSVKGTIFLLHGYLEHAALRAPIAREWVARGWEVVGLDLPGHGLSSGLRAEIDDFEVYADALETALEAHDWPRPRVAIAHSLGAATVLLVAHRRGSPFARAVLEAPLVRSFLWEPSRLAMQLLGDAISTLPRRASGISRRQAFYDRLKNDPLYIDRVPAAWFPALEAFVDQTGGWEPIEGTYLVLQGTADTVVDATYNLRLLGKLLPDLEVVTIPGGRHHLLMDEGPAGQMARETIRERFPAPG